MSAGKNTVQQFVAGNRKPMLEELTLNDAPNFVAVTEILTRLFDVSVRMSLETAGASFYAEDRSEVVLTVDKTGGVVVCNATNLRRIIALLRAARIHFVESYDWVLLGPDVRLNLIEEEASDVGVSVDDFKKMLSKWTN